MKHENCVNGIVVVLLLLTLNKFHTFLFHDTSFDDFCFFEQVNFSWGFEQVNFSWGFEQVNFSWGSYIIIISSITIVSLNKVLKKTDFLKAIFSYTLYTGKN